MDVRVLIHNGITEYQACVEEGIQWTTERKGTPGKLTFNVVKDGIISFQEGNSVRLVVDGFNVFYGFVFSKKRDKGDTITVTAYDQLRYLKNKDTYVYTNKTASDLVRMLAADFNLSVGTIENTSYIIESRVEDNTTLFDMIQNALDLELTNKGNMYVLYDDFGKLNLKGLGSMRLNLLIDEETGENFSYTSSIDDATYNKIKLSYENEETGKREIYVAQDSNNMNLWGVLQYFESIDEATNGQVKADALLSMYNAKTRSLKITGAFGDFRVRAGSMVAVKLNLGDVLANNFFLVESCKHTIKESEHLMDLSLRGGEFVG